MSYYIFLSRQNSCTTGNSGHCGGITGRNLVSENNKTTDRLPFFRIKRLSVIVIFDKVKKQNRLIERLSWETPGSFFEFEI